MHSPTTFVLGMFATFAAAQQITLTPSTIKGPQCPPTPPPRTVTLTATLVRTVQETTTATVVSTSTATVLKTTTYTERTTSRVTNTVTSVATVTTTRPCAGGGAQCPTLTSTGTACRTCLIPGCVETVAVTRPCGCAAALQTTTVNFRCEDRDSCNRIGCRTVYDVKTANC